MLHADPACTRPHKNPDASFLTFGALTVLFKHFRALLIANASHKILGSIRLKVDTRKTCLHCWAGAGVHSMQVTPRIMN